MKKSRMFRFVSETWNPMVGCLHMCSYCWARRIARRFAHTCRLCYEFKPHMHWERLNRKWRKPKIVFVVDMGDLFCDGIPSDWIVRILNAIRLNPKSYFLLQTKNPKRYDEFVEYFGKNVILGATIETNIFPITDRISRAPRPEERYRAMRDVSWENKFVSIEPILDFDLDVMIKWISDIEPMRVAVGYDNYNNRLDEPPLRKTLKLIEEIEAIGIEVERKTLRKAWWERLY